MLTTWQVNEKITFHADCLDSKFFCVNVPQYNVQYSTCVAWGNIAWIGEKKVRKLRGTSRTLIFKQPNSLRELFFHGCSSAFVARSIGSSADKVQWWNFHYFNLNLCANQMEDRIDLFFAARRVSSERVSNEFWNRVFFVFSSLELGIAVNK